MSGSMSDLEPPCFGFYAGNQSSQCGTCNAHRRCKAILITHGFDILGSIINQLKTELPDVPYRDSDRISEMFKQLKNPPEITLTSDEKELLNLVRNSDDLAGLDLA